MLWAVTFRKTGRGPTSKGKNRFCFLIASCWLTLLSGCGAGAMGQATIRSDAATDKGGLLSSLNAPLAVGATSRPNLKVEIKGSTGLATRLVSVRPDILTVRDGTLEGRAPGVSALLITDDKQVVLDFIHVWVKPANRIELHRLDAEGSDVGEVTEPIEMLVGDAVRLIPRPYAGSEALSGVATSSWSVEPLVATVLREGLPNRCRIVARSPGSATLKVTMLNATASIPLKVLP